MARPDPGHNLTDSIELSASQAISQAALDAVILIDSRGRIAHWNPAAERMFGYGRDEVLLREVHELLVPAEYRQRAMTGLGEFLRSGTGPVVGRLVELAAIRKDGTQFPIEISVAPVRIEGAWWALGIVRDITRRKLMEEAIAKEQRLLRDLLDLQERDRKLFAYELHDGLSQQISGAKFLLEAFRETVAKRPEEAWNSFRSAVAALSEALAETRRLIAGLRPTLLDELGVVAALEDLIDGLQSRSAPRVEFLPQVRFERLAPPLETTVFRIVQEALHNAVRHSGSQTIRVELIESGDRLRIVIQDWGGGFDPDQVVPGHFGLRGMQERARLFEGTFQLDSAPGQGTRIAVELPIVLPAAGSSADE